MPDLPYLLNQKYDVEKINLKTTTTANKQLAIYILKFDKQNTIKNILYIYMYIPETSRTYADVCRCTSVIKMFSLATCSQWRSQHSSPPLKVVSYNSVYHK
jgi:hypothetical protein